MKFAAVFALLALLATGCKIPAGNTYSVTTSGVGIWIGYNQTTQMPELKLGFFRQTLHAVPSNAAPVTSSLSLEQHGFSADILEEFTTGGAQIPTNSVAKFRAQRKAP